jgi:hypothetical protein
LDLKVNVGAVAREIVALDAITTTSQLFVKSSLKRVATWVIDVGDRAVV